MSAGKEELQQTNGPAVDDPVKFRYVHIPADT